MTPRQAYELALALTPYHERFAAFRTFNDIADDLVHQNWSRFHKVNGSFMREYGGIMHDTRGARHYAREWAEKAAKHEAVVGSSTKHDYLPEELTQQFVKWDALFVESGRQAIELIEKAESDLVAAQEKKS